MYLEAFCYFAASYPVFKRLKVVTLAVIACFLFILKLFVRFVPHTDSEYNYYEDESGNTMT